MAQLYRQYQAYTAPVLLPEIRIVFEWFARLSEPVQIEPGLSAAWQQVTSVGSARVEPLPADYMEPLSEPVRIKPFWRGNIQFFAADMTFPQSFILAAAESGDVASFLMTGNDDVIGADVSVVEIKPVNQIGIHEDEP